MGALREFGGYDAENLMCTKTVCKYISEGLMETQTTSLPSKLKRKPSHKGQNNRKIKRSLAKASRKGRKRRKSRETSGRWEGGLSVGLKSGQDEDLLTLTERLSRYTLVIRALSKQALENVAGLAGAIAQQGRKPSNLPPRQ
ncbi:MAG: hypothetical protein FWG10_04930 [Eubacteriaceae bacterium]|nr:hypothetical protein [Eubacteriaceae bacterium]